MADVKEMMAAYAADAVDYAAKLKYHLDYSEKSIESIEAICDLLYKSIPRGFFQKLFKKAPPDATIQQMAKMLGGYVGEVMIRQYGGSWSVEDFMGETTLLLTIGEMKTFPPSKVYKRLTNGPGDNLVYYYQVMVKELRQPG